MNLTHLFQRLTLPHSSPLPLSSLSGEGCRVGKLPGIFDDFLRQLQSGSGVQRANFVSGKSHPHPLPSAGEGIRWLAMLTGLIMFMGSMREFSFRGILSPLRAEENFPPTGEKWSAHLIPEGHRQRRRRAQE